MPARAVSSSCTSALEGRHRTTLTIAPPDSLASTFDQLFMQAGVGNLRPSALETFAARLQRRATSAAP
jgi:hypothetical protein